jgi:Protein of unknown function (DUF4058)
VERKAVPIHDWTRVDAGLFHAFHQSWIIALCNALNRGVLPSNYFALPEQSIGGPIPDVLSLRLSQGPDDFAGDSSGLAVATAPPRTRIVRHAPELAVYARKADHITVRQRHGQIVAVVEIVSPGNKASTSELRAFVEKSSGLIQRGVHLLVVDLFPPTKRDPLGIHKVIWDEIEDAEFELPGAKPLILAAYDAGPPAAAYVEPIAVGDVLPDMPLFLKPEYYVRAPLEAAYATAWADFPAALKRLLAG